MLRFVAKGGGTLHRELAAPCLLPAVGEISLRRIVDGSQVKLSRVPFQTDARITGLVPSSETTFPF